MCVSLSVSVSMRLCDGVCLGLTLGHDEVSGLSDCASVYESGLEGGLFPSIPSLWPRESAPRLARSARPPPLSCTTYS